MDLTRRRANWNERRSRASKLYRFLVRPRRIGWLFLVGVIGWTIVLTAAPLTPEQESISGALRLVATVIGAIVGILTIFGAGLALGARYVAEPVALRMVKTHEDRGAAAHLVFVAREEWDRKHEALRQEISDLTKAVIALTTGKKK